MARRVKYLRATLRISFTGTSGAQQLVKTVAARFVAP
jgi:hypothetical protein